MDIQRLPLYDRWGTYKDENYIVTGFSVQCQGGSLDRHGHTVITEELVEFH